MIFYMGINQVTLFSYIIINFYRAYSNKSIPFTNGNWSWPTISLASVQFSSHLLWNIFLSPMHIPPTHPIEQSWIHFFVDPFFLSGLRYFTDRQGSSYSLELDFVIANRKYKINMLQFQPFGSKLRPGLELRTSKF